MLLKHGLGLVFSAALLGAPSASDGQIVSEHAPTDPNYLLYIAQWPVVPPVLVECECEKFDNEGNPVQIESEITAFISVWIYDINNDGLITQADLTFCAPFIRGEDKNRIWIAHSQSESHSNKTSSSSFNTKCASWYATPQETFTSLSFYRYEENQSIVVEPIDHPSEVVCVLGEVEYVFRASWDYESECQEPRLQRFTAVDLPLEFMVVDCCTDEVGVAAEWDIESCTCQTQPAPSPTPTPTATPTPTPTPTPVPCSEQTLGLISETCEEAFNNDFLVDYYECGNWYQIFFCDAEADTPPTNTCGNIRDLYINYAITNPSTSSINVILRNDDVVSTDLSLSTVSDCVAEDQPHCYSSVAPNATRSSAMSVPGTGIVTFRVGSSNANAISIKFECTGNEIEP